MSKRKSSGPTRLNAVAPVDHALVKVLSSIREKNFKASNQEQRFALTAKEMLVMGRLKSSWVKIVGVQLAHKTCPERLLRGKLYLTVADSQWLQTLVFVKAQIIEKLQQHFPELKINDLVGRPGKIPAEVEEIVKDAEWPDWKEVEDMPLPEGVDHELAIRINSCRKHLCARNKGLMERGHNVCRKCNAGLTSSEDQICALCVSSERSQLLEPVKKLLHEMPWLSFDEVINVHEEIKSYEYEAVKSDLFDETTDLINDFFLQLKDVFTHENFVAMKKEMVRAIMLHSGCMPYEIDLYHLQPEQILDARWPEMINLEGGE